VCGVERKPWKRNETKQVKGFGERFFKNHKKRVRLSITHP
jgi:hypothetical protein